MISLLFTQSSLNPNLLTFHQISFHKPNKQSITIHWFFRSSLNPNEKSFYFFIFQLIFLEDCWWRSNLVANSKCSWKRLRLSWSNLCSKEELKHVFPLISSIDDPCDFTQSQIDFSPIIVWSIFVFYFDLCHLSILT